MAPMIPDGRSFCCLAFRNYAAPPALPAQLDLGGGLFARETLPPPFDLFWRDVISPMEGQMLTWAPNFVIGAVLDDDHHDLGRAASNRVQFIHFALVLICGVCGYDDAKIIAGRYEEKAIKKRSFFPGERLIPNLDYFGRAASTKELHEAVGLAKGLENIHHAGAFSGPYWRMMSGFDALLTGLRSERAYVKLHQFVRATEAFLSSKHHGAAVYAEQMLTFVAGTRAEDDPPPAEILRQMYQLRNAAEHHRGLEHGLPSVAADDRTSVANRRLRQAEELARTLYRYWLDMPASVRDLWKSDSSLDALWSGEGASKVWPEDRRVMLPA